MRVMTYNIQDGGAQRADLIADVIAQANPDVALLNEADDPDIAASLAGQLGLHHVWAPGSGDKHIALLSRLPILDWQIYNRRPLTQAVLVVRAAGRWKMEAMPPSSISLYCVHLLPYFMLLPYEFARWRTVRALLSLIKREAPGAHLILGDFNAVIRGEQADTVLFPPKRQRQLIIGVTDGKTREHRNVQFSQNVVHHLAERAGADGDREDRIEDSAVMKGIAPRLRLCRPRFGAPASGVRRMHAASV